MYFRRIKLENWRNFLTVDVELQRRTFIVGPNASGKSNLLDAFRFLREVADPQGGFQRAVARIVGERSADLGNDLVAIFLADDQRRLVRDVLQSDVLQGIARARD